MNPKYRKLPQGPWPRGRWHIGRDWQGLEPTRDEVVEHGIIQVIYEMLSLVEMTHKWSPDTTKWPTRCLRSAGQALLLIHKATRALKKGDIGRADEAVDEALDWLKHIPIVEAIEVANVVNIRAFERKPSRAQIARRLIESAL